MHHTPWHLALEKIYEHGAQRTMTTRKVPLDQAIGQVLAEDIHTLIPLPHYDSSAMDGYAVRGNAPWKLQDGAKLATHENRHCRTVALEDGCATTILTGGLIPPGAESVIRLEWVNLVQSEGETWVVPERLPAPGADMRRIGEELAQGSLAVAAGTRLGARHIAFLSVCGIDQVLVNTRAAVAVAYTGNEVITRGVPGPGEVRDAYSAQFPTILQQMGAEVLSTSRLHDDEQELRDWFEATESQRADVLLLTGGSSTSEVDLVRTLLAQLNATYIFEAVAVRPGHPCLAAVLPNQCVVIGLPGNPLAAHVSLYSYLPALLAGMNQQPLPATQQVTLTRDVRAFAKKDLRLIPAVVAGEHATPFERGAQSHMLSAFAEANALIAVAPTGAEAGEKVDSLPIF
ncbi:MAG: molybdopterin molybdotransferase MoeA [Rothia sp. (in: high G+C Gram-positive bacteria)]|nr:molybdopterin molybdotransferase MoeA [Rothia sp. (in: high G+C Gram-positive bacteria)]